MNYLDNVAKLNTLTLDCHQLQKLINLGRKINPNDQSWQLELDHRQAKLTERVELIDSVRSTIEQRN